MDVGNETALRQCRFLSEGYFSELYEAFISAFSDYVFQFALTAEQFRNHIVLNAVDLNRTVGCVEAGRLIAFSLNGFGDWHGRSTVYDAGTGVIPKYRRQGLSGRMFDMMLPIFEREGVEQFLLEVVTSNTGAIRLYEKLEFNPVRELALLQCDGDLKPVRKLSGEIEIKLIDEPEWPRLNRFWDGEPSWQNSIPAMIRSRRMKVFRGAFLGDECVGFIAYSSNFGRLAQIAVAQDHRNRGIGTGLVRAMQADMADGYSMQVINIDKSLDGPMEFFRKLGFYQRLSQFEMLKKM